MLRMMRKWRRDEEAVVALEVGLLMPLMLLILVSIVDMGNAILSNQKVLTASQTVADLLGRESAASSAILNDSVEAGRLAMMPYDMSSFGVDIAGIQFDGGPNNPKLIWRETVNMVANPDIVTEAAGLGADKEGVLGVTVQYIYQPYFSGLLTGAVRMREVSYVRGRNGLFIPRV